MRAPPPGFISLGSLDRVTPISRSWGFDRGTPVDRLYIERFLEEFSDDIRGNVLEVSNNHYTTRFGEDRVTKSDVLNIDESDKNATLIMDLADTAAAPSDRFDCIICTQTLHLIYDLNSALRSLHKMLKPGGTLLITGPTITSISRWEMDLHGDNWRFTSVALRRIVGDIFTPSEPTVRSYGNVYAAISFLHGLAIEELDAEKLEFFDPDYEMLIAIRVTREKPAG